MIEPKVTIGILHTTALSFYLQGSFQSAEGIVSGQQHAMLKKGAIFWNGKTYQELEFTPIENDATFQLHNVLIGIAFHWQRHEHQTFQGKLKLMIEHQQIVAINQIDVEQYLLSVISSEMSAHAGLELLKAHAVISRSWLLAQINHKDESTSSGEVITADKIIRWYGHSEHQLYDVCADDHCQRYQGIQKAENPHVQQAIDETRGLLLMYNNEICDARFSKCCGGKMELYSSCWEDKDYPYLVVKDDRIGDADTFCNTNNPLILRQILNKYDQETHDFFRWSVTYTQQGLSALIKEKSELDFGVIQDLIPVKRGGSGRIIELKIVGSLLTKTIGKELEIRRTLSQTHLYSSNFTVHKDAHNNFTLHGLGWGHGVGLCQIGAAVMGDKGYKYNEILAHYYPGAELIKQYE